MRRCRAFAAVNAPPVAAFRVFAAAFRASQVAPLRLRLCGQRWWSDIPYVRGGLSDFPPLVTKFSDAVTKFISHREICNSRREIYNSRRETDFCTTDKIFCRPARRFCRPVRCFCRPARRFCQGTRPFRPARRKSGRPGRRVQSGRPLRGASGRVCPAQSSASFRRSAFSATMRWSRQSWMSPSMKAAKL